MCVCVGGGEVGFFFSGGGGGSFNDELNHEFALLQARLFKIDRKKNKNVTSFVTLTL